MFLSVQRCTQGRGLQAMKDYTNYIEEVNQYYGYSKITSELQEYEKRDILADYLKTVRIRQKMKPSRKEVLANHIRKTTDLIYEQLLDIQEQLEILNNDPQCSSLVSFERITQLSDELLDRLQDMDNKL